MPDNIMRRVEKFVELAQVVVDRNMDQRFPTLEKHTLRIGGGRKYLQIIEEYQAGSIDNPRTAQRIFAFIDLTNGDLLKPESFKKPAKHARGNIFDDDYAMRNVGPYGVAYMVGNTTVIDKPLGKI